jgi:predicted nuclease of predicted toxin-antitoxin system
MRFLVDTNLPPALAEWLTTQGHEAMHTSELGMAAAKDSAIWEHAQATNACIVTKDEDFVLLKTSRCDGPPILWVRIGNAVRSVLLQRVAAAWPTVLAKINEGEGVVEIR